MKNLTAFLLAAFLPLCALAQVKDGDAAPDFKFKTPDGTEYTMASFKGKLVFIDVWATWCPPCRAEIPALKALEKTFEGQDVVFVSISVDKDKSAWEKFVREQSLGGVSRLRCFIGDTYDANLYRLDGYGNLANVDNSDFEYLINDIVQSLEEDITPPFYKEQACL